MGKNSISEIKGNFDLIKKAVSKLRQCFGERIDQVAQRMRVFSSKWWQRFRKYIKHIDKVLFIFVFFLVAFVALAVAVAVEVPENIVGCLQELLGLSEKDEMLKFIGFCIAGVVSIWLAWAANKRANAIDATAKNTEAGQRQERLKNAIEHLGHDRDSVRMGGAYELFHLAKDTEGLRQTVLDILCAHIRQTTRGKDYQAEHKTKPSEEIQSLLTLLFAQKHDVFEGCSINLQGSYLNGANLTKAKLYGAVLDKAQLQGADLMNAQLQGADLLEVQLQGADLSATQLQGANLLATQLQGANLGRAQLQGAKLFKSQLFFNAQLQEAILRDTQLQGVMSHEAYPPPPARFEEKIKNRIGKDSDLTGIIFAGRLREKDLETLCRGLSAKKAQALQEKLRPQVGKPVSHELPENSGAATGAYTQEEAKQWIAEFNKAMRKAPRADDTADAVSAPNSDKDKGD